jgi:hypothetical protein
MLDDGGEDLEWGHAEIRVGRAVLWSVLALGYCIGLRWLYRGVVRRAAGGDVCWRRIEQMAESAERTFGHYPWDDRGY